ncbi:hypothetical protein K9L04_01755 [Patescibacteria group bacterium]|nr:hypothetical protein [Patescibacteria group bacterium]
MKKDFLSDFYLFNSRYIFKVLSDFLAFFIFFIFFGYINFLGGLIFYGFFTGIFILTIFPDALRSIKEGVFFLKFIFNSLIFLFFLINPLIDSSLTDFKTGLMYFLIISVTTDFLLLIFHCLCYRYYSIEAFFRKIKNKFNWIDC